eukprot:SAG31_NODE_1527_length_8004_cov_2.107147_3_plen_103_part_00
MFAEAPVLFLHFAGASVAVIIPEHRAPHFCGRCHEEPRQEMRMGTCEGSSTCQHCTSYIAQGTPVLVCPSCRQLLCSECGAFSSDVSLVIKIRYAYWLLLVD